jgi:hypothetical protein
MVIFLNSSRILKDLRNIQYAIAKQNNSQVYGCQL